MDSVSRVQGATAGGGIPGRRGVARQRPAEGYCGGRRGVNGAERHGGTAAAAAAAVSSPVHVALSRGVRCPLCPPATAAVPGPPAMFARATSNLVRQIDAGGALIPVSRLNDSDKLLPLSVVVKRRRFWFWQQPKYLVSDFTLNDMLTGDRPLDPAVVETDFLKYEGTFGDVKGGGLDAEVNKMGINVEGRGSSKLRSSFGAMKKQEVDIQKLLHDSRGRVLDLEHCLIQQIREKHNEVVGVVKERVLTAEPCLISEQLQEQGECGAALGFRRPTRIQVSVKQNGSVLIDSEVLLEIPPHTVIAYSIIELEVKANGEFDLCLLPDVLGGFEVDSHTGTRPAVCVPAGKDLQETPPNVHLNEMRNLAPHFQQLADLPPQARSRLVRLLRETVQDGVQLAALREALDELCQGGAPDRGQLEVSCQNHGVQEFLDVLQVDRQGALQEAASPLILACHLLVSALEEMSAEGLHALGRCSRPPLLQALRQLVHTLETGGKDPLRPAAASLLLQDEVFQAVELLFSSCNATVRREGDTLLAKAGSGTSPSPLVLCIVVGGLAALSEECM
ncbi:non-syndromic hearing impairment protein 5-like isoform X1 [Arapaima gigas]